MHFEEVYTLEIAFLQSSCIMEVCAGGAYLWLYPEHRAEAKQDLQFLNVQKMGEHEAEIEKIKSVLLAILRDIKKEMDCGEQPGKAVTADLFQQLAKKMIEQTGK